MERTFVAPVDERQVLEILNGDIRTQQEPRPRIVRLYLSSTVGDVDLERERLHSDVFPVLSRLSFEYGLQFHLIDLQSGVPLSLLYEHATLELVSQEVALCQQLTVGPSLVTILAQKYGRRPLPTCIPARVWQHIATSADHVYAECGRDVVTRAYRLDENAVPPMYFLQSKEDILSDIQEAASDGIGEEQMVTLDWPHVELLIGRAVRAATASVVKERSARLSLLMSLGEAELSQGVFLCKDDPNKHVFWLKRFLISLKQQMLKEPSVAQQYLDTISTMRTGRQRLDIDVEAQKLLNSLRDDKMTTKYVGLEKSNIYKYDLRWITGGVDPGQNKLHREYLDNFTKDALKCLVDCLHRNFAAYEQQVGDTLYQEVLCHIHDMKTKCQNVNDRHGIVDKIERYLLSENPGYPLVVHGSLGSGKSAMTGKAVARLREKFGNSVSIVLRSIEATASSRNVRQLLRGICLQLHHLFCPSEPEVNIADTYRDLLTQLPHYLSLARPDHPLYLVLDGLDHLRPTHGALNLEWLPLSLPASVHMVVVTSEEPVFRCFPELQHRLNGSEKFVEVPELNAVECKVLTEAMLCKHDRTLTEEQMEAFLDTAELCATPQFITLSVQHVLKHWSSWQDANDLRIPATSRDIVFSVFERVERRFGWQYVNHALGYVTASRHGLSEPELLDILSCDEKIMDELSLRVSLPRRRFPFLLWSELRQSLGSLLVFSGVDNSCVLRWCSRLVEDAARDRYLTRAVKRDRHSALADFFLGKWSGKAKPFRCKQRVEDGILATDSSEDRGIMLQPLCFGESPDSVGVSAMNEASKSAMNEASTSAMNEANRSAIQEASVSAMTEASKSALYGTSTSAMKGTSTSAMYEASGSELNKVSTSAMHEACMSAVNETTANAMDKARASESKRYNLRKLNELPYQLVESGRLEEIRRSLLSDYSWMLTKIRACGVAALIADFDPLVPSLPQVMEECHVSEELRLLRDTLLLASPSLRQNSEHLSAELLTRLLPLVRNDQAHERSRLHNLIKASRDTTVSSLTPLACPFRTAGQHVMSKLRSHSQAVTCLALKVVPGSRDPLQCGAYQSLVLVSGSNDRTARYWDPFSGDMEQMLEGHQSPVTCLDLDKTGELCVTGDEQGVLRVWTVKTGVCEAVMIGHSGRVNDLCVLSHSHRTVSVGQDGTVRFWNTDLVSSGLGKELFKLESPVQASSNHDNSLHSIVLSCDESRLYTGGASGEVAVWGQLSGELQTVLQFHTAAVSGLAAVTGRPNQVVSGSHDRAIALWDTSRPQRPITIFRGHTAPVSGVTVDDSRHRIFSCALDSTVRVWDISTAAKLLVVTVDYQPLAVLKGVNGRYALTALSDGTVTALDLDADPYCSAPRCHRGRTTALVAQGNTVISGSQDGGVFERSLLHDDGGYGETVRSSLNCDSPVRALALLSQGGDDEPLAFLSAHASGKMHHWQRVKTDGAAPDTTTKHAAWTNVRTFIKHRKPVNALLQLQARVAVTSSDDSTSLIWDIWSGQVLSRLIGHRAPLTASALCRPNNGGITLVVTASKDGTANAYDITATLDDVINESSATSSQSSPTAEHLVIADVRPVFQLRPVHSSPLSAVTASADGTSIFTATTGGELSSWSSTDGSPLHSHTCQFPVTFLCPLGDLLAIGDTQTCIKVCRSLATLEDPVASVMPEDGITAFTCGQSSDGSSSSRS
eukprot:scpid11072/ scgid0674/ Leucine-rich repeat and WD repeat-containing protein KIAA1239